VRQLAEALAYAHRQGVVHRDVKPANVLLRPPGGEALLADFGLAARVDEERLTLEGEVLGTLDYMAPEQALGHASPASDQYSLGCLFYELLTGRPPFAGNSLTHTLFLHQTKPPVAPRSLNAAIPLDVETICLKSLEKEPGRRYADCQELADDLRRWLEGEPIRARRLGLPERLLRWVRREPRLAALTAAVVSLLLVVLVGGLWLERLGAERERQRLQQRTVVQSWLGQARDSGKRGRWREARTVLEQALAQPGLEGEPDLREELQAALGRVKRVLELAAIRVKASQPGASRGFDRAGADRDYAAFFAAADLVVPDRPAHEVADRIRATGIAQELVAALDDWAIRTTDANRRSFLLEVARTVDPGEWSDRLRDPQVWKDRAALARLAEQVPVRELSPQLLLVFGRALWAGKVAALPLLRRAQAEHPDDFWLAYQLGTELHEAKRSEEAAGALRVALALQVDNQAAYNFLGVVLREQGKQEEAIANYQKALSLDPGFGNAYTNLGSTLMDQGKVDEAIASFQKACDLTPGAAEPFHNLGMALQGKGKVEEAQGYFRKALSLDPRSAATHLSLGESLAGQGRIDEAIAHYQKAIALDPGDARAPTNLATAYLSRGNLDDAIAHYRKAIALDPRLAEIWFNLGFALGLRGQTEEAITHYRKAIELQPGFADAHCNLGLTLQRQGRFAEALQSLQRGHEVGSRRPGWSYPSARWVRTCQRQLQLQGQLPDLLVGKIVPASEAERLEYARVGSLTRQQAAAARLYVEAFAAEPKLADDLQAGHRYRAACAAALAGCGQGRDSTSLDDRERNRLRRQALGWLRADLTLLRKHLTGSTAEAGLARRSLDRWRKDPDLAGVREPAAVAKLPAGERAEWEQLWVDVTEALRQPAAKK
jgi:serine/threonine-protein kinase